MSAIESILESAKPLVYGPHGLTAGEAEPLLDCSLGEDLLSGFMASAHTLVERLRRREEQFNRLLQITQRVNYGVVLEDVLEFVYRG